MNVDKDIAVCGKACPIPLITLAREVSILQKGQLLRITGNAPSSRSLSLIFAGRKNTREWKPVATGKSEHCL